MEEKKRQTELLAETAHDTADHCVACTSCIANCPVTAATTKFAGPKLIGPAHSRMTFAEEDVEKTLDYCSNCKNCDMACPSGVAVSTLNMLQRGEYYRTHPHSQRDDMLAHGERMGKLLRSIPFGATFGNLGMKVGTALGVFGAIGISPERSLPEYASKSFKQRFKEVKQKKSDKQVVFFPGCFINDNDPEVGVAFIEVMQANGYEVLLDEDFICCGSPMIASGYLDEAHEHAKKNTARILEWKKKGIPVVACCTSCSLMLKQEYTELFEEDKMKEAGENIYDAFEYLNIMEEKGELSSPMGTISHHYTYHEPCHLKAQGLGIPSLERVREIPGVSVYNMDAGCCGMSGSYGFKKEKYEVSMKIGEKLFERIQADGADTVLCDCGTCRLQIKHGTKKKTMHPIQLLAESYKKA